MKATMKKSLLTVAMTVALGAASTGAMAAIFDPFAVQETSVPGAIPNLALSSPAPGLEPGKITGNYVESITFSGGTSGTFTASLRWNAGQYVATDGSTTLPSQLGSLSGNQYGLYALLTSTGTYAPGAGSTTVFTLGSGSPLSVWIDPLSDTTFANAALTGGSADDYQIASGLTIGGTGTLDTTLPTCGPGKGINCGSFGTSTSFALTALGSNYFISPIPFYNLSFQSGQLNVLVPTSTQAQLTNGSLDVVFGNSVPEPASLALMGIGLMGLAASVRRRKQV